VYRKAHQQWCRIALPRARRRLSANPLRDIAARLGDRQPTETYRRAPVLLDPELMGVLQMRDFSLYSLRERLGIVGSFANCPRRHWRMPIQVGLRARIVVRKILDDHRSALALQ